MAAKALLPGLGGKYTTETFNSSSTTGADTLDCSHFEQLAIQVEADGSAAGTVNIEHTFDGTNWAILVEDLPVATANDGEVFRLDAMDGPFGVLRVDATDISAGTASLTIAGFKGSKL